jgi:hypothetical protein
MRLSLLDPKKRHGQSGASIRVGQDKTNEQKEVKPKGHGKATRGHELYPNEFGIRRYTRVVP